MTASITAIVAFYDCDWEIAAFVLRRARYRGSGEGEGLPRLGMTCAQPVSSFIGVIRKLGDEEWIAAIATKRRVSGRDGAVDPAVTTNGRTTSLRDVRQNHHWSIMFW
jgi:hypothetical protein